MYATITLEVTLAVKYLEPTRSQNEYRLSDTEFEVFRGDMMCKVTDPIIFPVGGDRLYYNLTDSA